MTAYRSDRDAKLARFNSVFSQIEDLERRFKLLTALEIAHARAPHELASWTQLRERVIEQHEHLSSLSEPELETALNDAEALLAHWQVLSANADQLEAAVTVPAPEAPAPPRILSGLLGPIAVPLDLEGGVFREARELPKQVGAALRLAGCEDVAFDWEVEPTFGALPWVCRAQTRLRNTPIACLFEVTLEMGATIAMTSLSTAVPAAAPPLLVLSRGAWKKRLFANRSRFGVEQRTGDEDFDASYALRTKGDAPLDVQGRKALMELLPARNPSLMVDNGAALIRWQYGPEKPLLCASIELLELLRERPTGFRLRAE
jgi:hypothetical protein